MTPTPPRDDRARQRIRRGDDGSLMLAILLAIMVGALILVATATVIAGLNKTRATRDFTITQQAAQAAVDEALVMANMVDLSRKAGGITSAGSNDGVTWTWTAKLKPSLCHHPRVCAEVQITVSGTDIEDRAFVAVLEEFKVSAWERQPDGIHYTAGTGGPGDFAIWQITEQATLSG